MKFLLIVPVTLCCVGLEVLVPERGMLPLGDMTGIPLNRTFKTWLFWTPHASDSVGKERVIVLAWMIGPVYQREIGLLLYKGYKEECGMQEVP